jgi:glycerophosphoryl diester phosphodiesterase
MRLMTFCLLALLTLVGATGVSRTPEPGSGFIVVAHRGASGYLPEHTLPAYAMAYAQGADMIEPDVVATRDGHLVCLHDLTLESTTDAPSVFPDRARADGSWYAVDFDLAELKQLEKHGRDSDDAGYSIATLDEMLTLIHRLNERTGRAVGVVPEIKHPAFHTEHGIDLARLTIAALEERGYSSATDRIYVQCFDADTLRRIRFDLDSELPLMYLSGDPVPTDTLRSIGTWCQALGINRSHLDPALGGDPALIVAAQQAGLAVIPYTLKSDPRDIERLIEAGVDGVFADYPDVALRCAGR